MKDKKIRIPISYDLYSELTRYYNDDDYLLGMSFENKELVIEIHKIRIYGLKIDESKLED